MRQPFGLVSLSGGKGNNRGIGRLIGQLISPDHAKDRPWTPRHPSPARRNATDVSQTVTDVTAALKTAVGQLSEAIATAREPGKPLATIAAITREAPLASLFVAFLFGVALTRRR